MESSQLNLSYRGFAEIPTWVDEHRHAEFVDVSHNSLTGLRFLYGFSSLKVLCADYNEIASLRTCPNLDNLDTLSLNRNSISDLDELVQTVKEKLPKLDNLSLLKNPCCPYFNLGVTEDEIVVYRLKIIAKLPKLKILDGSSVSSRERLDSLCANNRLMMPSQQPYGPPYDDVEKKTDRVTAKVNKASNK